MNKERIKVLYILGGGHSGSTILSLILGTAPEIFDAGEIKFFNEHKIPNHPMWRYIENVCMCGKDALDCPFWQRVESKFDRKLNIFHYSSIFEKFNALYKILSPFHRVSKNNNANDDYELLRAILAEARADNPSTNIILDASKSVARLMHLMSHSDIDVQVIFMIRDGRAYANSYRKAYKKWFSRWMMQWIIINFLSLRYIRKEKIDFYYLSYNALCLEPEKHLSAMEERFNINLPSEYIELINNQEYHVRAGNPSRTELKEFTGLQLEENWRTELPAFYRNLSTAILSPFNRRWL